MRTRKPRLYLALYARLKDPQTYHYALLVCPKHESVDSQVLDARKYHCKNIIQSKDGTISMPWTFEATNVNSNNDHRLLVRMALGKIRKPDRVESSMRKVPIRQDDPCFNCVEWVRLALAQMELDDLLGTDVKLDWDRIKGKALEYVQEKKRQGRFELSWKGNISKAPTYEYTTSTEIVS